MLKYILKCDLITEKDLTMKCNSIIYLFQHNNSNVFLDNYKYFIKYSEKYFSSEKYNDNNNLNALSYILQNYSDDFYKQKYDENDYQKECFEYYFETYKSIIDIYCEIHPDILNKLDKNYIYPINYCLNNVYIVDYIIKKGFDINNFDFIKYYNTNKPFNNKRKWIKLINYLKYREYWIQYKYYITNDRDIHFNYYYSLFDLCIYHHKFYNDFAYKQSEEMNI